MHNETDSSWGVLAAACIRQIQVPIATDTRAQRIQELARANASDQVFTRRNGGRQLKWRWSTGQLMPPRVISRNNSGWRENPEGPREQVRFYEGEGWLSSDELFELRQRSPRTAP